MSNRRCTTSTDYHTPLPFPPPLIHSLPHPQPPPPPHCVSPTLKRNSLSSHSFNKYIQIAGRATRNALKEEERLKAEKRNTVTLKWQTWKDGKGSAQVRFDLSSSFVGFSRVEKAVE